MLDERFWTELAGQWIKEAPKTAPVEKIEIQKDTNQSLLDFLNSIDDDDI